MALAIKIMCNIFIWNSNLKFARRYDFITRICVFAFFRNKLDIRLNVNCNSFLKKKKLQFLSYNNPFYNYLWGSTKIPIQWWRFHCSEMRGRPPLDPAIQKIGEIRGRPGIIRGICGCWV